MCKSQLHFIHCDSWTTSYRFMTTFDVDWAEDVTMILIIMCSVLFNPMRSDVAHPDMVATRQMKWTDRLRR